ncbi:hypothetical protein QZH41_003594 [Actinostola sp. cb2023]|nr:hypothetical protein QZH41_003594 [Actinostola sp. cb2023]
MERDSKTGKVREAIADGVTEGKRKGKGGVDTGIRKQGKQKRSTEIDNSRKDVKQDNVVPQKSEGRTPVGNGEVKKVKQRPKFSKSKYAAIATEEDDYEDEESEILDEEQKPEKPKAAESRGSHREPGRSRQTAKATAVHEHQVRGHANHDRSKHVWLCRDDEIHKLIAQKASLLKEYESGSLAGRNVFCGQMNRHHKDAEDTVLHTPDVGFSGSRPKPRHTRPVSEILPDREPYTARKRENRRSLQQRYSGSSSEDDDERTNKRAGNVRAEKAASGGTFTVGMASRHLAKREEPSDSEHEETCEYCAAEKASKKAQERDLASTIIMIVIIIITTIISYDFHHHHHHHQL